MKIKGPFDMTDYFFFGGLVLSTWGIATFHFYVGMIWAGVILLIMAIYPRSD